MKFGQVLCLFLGAHSHIYSVKSGLACLRCFVFHLLVPLYHRIAAEVQHSLVFESQPNIRHPIPNQADP